MIKSLIKSLSLSLSLSPFPDDIWPQYERTDGESEPDWVKTEREHFNKHRDKNNDGSLDKEEISQWISPPDYDHSQAEAKHLIYEADTNKVQVRKLNCSNWAKIIKDNKKN